MRDVIIAANQKFMEVFSAGAATMGDLYTKDAKIYPPGGDPVSGSTAIGTFWKGAYEAGVKRARLDTVEAEPAGDQIVEVGNFTLFGDGDTQLDTGKYLVVWKQDAGTWKLHRDIWNTSVSGQ
ncbi:YybH family protein [Spirosoma koreense]